MTDDVISSESTLRDLAVKQIKKKRDFAGHVLIYVLVNTFLVGIWAYTGNEDSHFWPLYVMLGWGIGLVANAYDVYFAKPITEDEIEREMEHLSHR